MTTRNVTVDRHQNNQLDAEVSSQALLHALKCRHEGTQLHSDRVANLAVEIGKSCALTSVELSHLRLGANLHDIGKIGIPDYVLFKPGSFDSEEKDIMQAHSIKGQEIVSNLSFTGKDDVGLMVRHHHENFDGSGYPDSLTGEDIPICSRIISVVDNYDALSERRVYHEPKEQSEVLDFLIAEKNRKFDPFVLGKFLGLVEGSLRA